MKTILAQVLSLTLLTLLSACTVGSNIISPAYYPTTTVEVSGNVEVRQFEYTPKYSFYSQNATTLKPFTPKPESFGPRTWGRIYCELSSLPGTSCLTADWF